MTQTETKKPGLIAKLKQHRDDNSGDATVLLKETKVTVTYPKFRNHGIWSGCMRAAKNKVTEAQVFYVCKLANFDGEKLTATDFNAYIPMSDATDLLAEIFDGSDDAEDFSGKTKKA